jgi:uncharacterized protein with von Willebrand factor type A (vWA) domain
MLLRFFDTLRSFRVPVSTRELLDLLAVLRTGIGFADQAAFYHLGRLTLVKDERFFDRYDRAFRHFFDGLDGVEGVLEAALPQQALEELLQELLQLDRAGPDATDARGDALRELLGRYRERVQALRAARAGERSGDAGEGEGEASVGADADANADADAEGEGEDGEDGEGDKGERGKSEGDNGEDGEGEDGEDGEGEEGDDGEGEEGSEGDGEIGADGEADTGERKDQDESRRRVATRVWEERLFADLDDDVELGTRTFKIALRRLRRFARTGAEEELDMAGTIAATARNGGILDIRMVPERRNTVKVLLLLDIGGSMDEHVQACQQLFSAARGEFKYLVPLYFHNFTYEHLWSEAARRDEHRVPVIDVVRRYGSDCKLVFVGDANMGLHELLERGGCIERYNERPGVQWFGELTSHFRRVVWINPSPVAQWPDTFSTVRVQRMLEGAMFPLTNEGLTSAMRVLAR